MRLAFVFQCRGMGECLPTKVFDQRVAADVVQDGELGTRGEFGLRRNRHEVHGWTGLSLVLRVAAPLHHEFLVGARLVPAVEST